MREMLKEELSDAKKRIEELERELKILLLPKDPNDDKNVIVEIRAGAGGDEAALFAAEMYRLYVKYAEKNRWKVELMNCDEIGIGGMKEVNFMITGRYNGSEDCSNSIYKRYACRSTCIGRGYCHSRSVAYCNGTGGR